MGSITLSPQALGRVAIRETLGRRIRKAAEQADEWQRISALANLRAERKDWLQPDDFIAFGRKVDIHPAIVHALADAETAPGQKGFDANGRLTILAEPHVFSQLTHHAFDVTHPHLSYPRWVKYERGAAPPAGFDRHPYTYDQDRRWQLIIEQAQLNFDAACGAMSGGRFQQLFGSRRKGEGHKALGFAAAWDLVQVVGRSEFEQLEILYLYLRVNGLIPAFRRMDWRAIARGYNGGGQVALYAGRMAAAYANRRKLYA